MSKAKHGARSRVRSRVMGSSGIGTELDHRIEAEDRAGDRAGVKGAGYRMQGTGYRVQGTGVRGQGSGDTGQGTGDRGQGTWYRVGGRG